MDKLHKKSQELDLRNIMQGLEEFATFMSFQSNYSDLRIISVESVEAKHQQEPKVRQQANVYPIRQVAIRNDSKDNRSITSKSLAFQDRIIH